jgi:ParB/RepB/Spo0J family partition protein
MVTKKRQTNNGTEPATDARPAGSVEIPLAQISPSPLNPRKTFDEAALTELADSARAHGILQPVLVRPLYRTIGGALIGRWAETVVAMPGLLLNGLYELVDGERRFRAAKLAGLRTIPVIVRELDDRQVLEIAMITSEQRGDLTPLEKAAGYQRLISEHGATVEELAAQLGRSVSTIRGLLKLLDLPPLAREATESGRLSPSVAQLIARVPGAESRDEFARCVLAGVAYSESPDLRLVKKAIRDGQEPLSFRNARELLQHRFMVELKLAPFDQADAELVPKAGNCLECPKRAGNNPDYAEARADVCSDPTCYREKVQAWQKRTIAEGKAAGQKLLDNKSARAVFPYGSEVSEGSGYMDLARQAHGVGKGKQIYAELIEPHIDRAEIVLAFDRHENLHRLVKRARVVEILRDVHKFKPSPAAAKDANGSPRVPRDAEEETKRRAEARLRRETDRLLLERVAESAAAVAGNIMPAPVIGALRVAEVLRPIVADVISKLWHNHRDEICARRGIKGKSTSDRVSALEASIRDMSAPALIGLLAECVGGRAIGGFRNGPADELLKLLKIPSRKQLEKEARARIKVCAKTKNGTPVTRNLDDDSPESDNRDDPLSPGEPPRKDTGKLVPSLGRGTVTGGIGDPASVNKADTEYEEWVREVRDPAESDNEGQRSIEVKGAWLRYIIAALPDGRWAYTYHRNLHMSNSSCPWIACQTREQCLGHVLDQARRYFRPDWVGDWPKVRLEAQKRMWRLLDPAVAFIEPEPKAKRATQPSLVDAVRTKNGTAPSPSAASDAWRQTPLSDLELPVVAERACKARIKERHPNAGDLADLLESGHLKFKPSLTAVLRERLAILAGGATRRDPVKTQADKVAARRCRMCQRTDTSEPPLYWAEDDLCGGCEDLINAPA